MKFNQWYKENSSFYVFITDIASIDNFFYGWTKSLNRRSAFRDLQFSDDLSINDIDCPESIPTLDKEERRRMIVHVFTRIIVS